MTDEIGRIRLSVYVCLFAFGCALTAEAAAANIPEEIQKLSKDHSRSERLDAIEQLHHEYQTNGSEKAIPELSVCAKDDDPAIRFASLSALTMIAHGHKLACPDALVGALFDTDNNVRAVATNFVGVYDDYSKESFALAYKALAHEDTDVRNSALCVIGCSGQNDKEKAIAAVKKALNDKSLMVRGNAEVALWKLTGDRELKIRNLVERFVAPDPSKTDPTISKEEIGAFNLWKLGGSMGLFDMSNERPREVAASLIKLTKDASPSIRRGAASNLGGLFIHNDKTEAGEKRRRFTADMGIVKALQSLRDDPDGTVRAAAIGGLEEIEESKAKEPLKTDK